MVFLFGINGFVCVCHFFLQSQHWNQQQTGHYKVMDRRNVRKRAVKKVNVMLTLFGNDFGETDDHGAAVHDEEPSWFGASQEDVPPPGRHVLAVEKDQGGDDEGRSQGDHPSGSLGGAG